ncbi:uncharacterized protein TNCV_2324241 [Trichonephila clavipes]|nr:uncharacterized protein TNCV_2324241 [Trichonephila clavipes]
MARREPRVLTLEQSRTLSLLYSTTSGLSATDQVVKVSNHGWHVSSSSPVPQKTRRVGQRCTLNLSRAEMSSRWCGVVVRRGGASSGVALVIWSCFKITRSITKSPYVAEQCDVNIHSLGDGPRNFKPCSSDEDDA